MRTKIAGFVLVLSLFAQRAVEGPLYSVLKVVTHRVEAVVTGSSYENAVFYPFKM